jgi:hypothetical protein
MHLKIYEEKNVPCQIISFFLVALENRYVLAQAIQLYEEMNDLSL